MKRIKIRKIEIGAGMPKICVPITGTTEQELLEQVKKAVEKQPDLIEWRADFYERLKQPEQVRKIVEDLRTHMKEIPLLFTVRTKEEGGNFSGSIQEYTQLLISVAEMEEVDIIDVELYKQTSEMKKIIHMLRTCGKIVIVSNHHFQETPSVEQMIRIMQDMEESGAHIRKLAVMPQKSEDVLNLLTATLKANETGTAPVVTMSMGRLGVLSRVCGELVGSCITFGTVGEASAPGQLAIEELRNILIQLRR